MFRLFDKPTNSFVIEFYSDFNLENCVKLSRVKSFHSTEHFWEIFDFNILQFITEISLADVYISSVHFYTTNASEPQNFMSLPLFLTSSVVIIRLRNSMRKRSATGLYNDDDNLSFGIDHGKCADDAELASKSETTPFAYFHRTF